jgi:hypothetical protein
VGDSKEGDHMVGDERFERVRSQRVALSNSGERLGYGIGDSGEGVMG